MGNSNMIYKKTQRLARDSLRLIKTKLPHHLTIGRAITYLRRKSLVDDHLVYIYIVDEQDILLGVVRVRDLLLQNPQKPVHSIMQTNVISVHELDTLHEALCIMENRHLLAIPVVDNRNRLLGVIDIRDYFEEAIDVDSSKKRWQIFQTLGLMLHEEGLDRKIVWKVYKSRMPWIFCNMIGGFLCAFISNIYKDVLSNILVLAMFTPLVLALSEAISMQAMTQSIIDIGKKTQSFTHFIKNLYHDVRLFSLLAISSGVIVGSTSLLWKKGFGPALIIASSIMISVTSTALLGVMIPVLIHKWRLDPKIASGPVVLMLADVFTISVYLSLGFYFLL